MRLHIINVETTCKLQLTRLSFKNIRYYRLKITPDKIHEVIHVSVGLIQYSNLIYKYSWTLQQTFAMSNTL